MRYIAEGKTWPDSSIWLVHGLQRAYQETLGLLQLELTSRAMAIHWILAGWHRFQMASAPEIGLVALKPAFGESYASESAGESLDAAV